MGWEDTDEGKNASNSYENWATTVSVDVPNRVDDLNALATRNF